ncbi:MAG TPA: TetR/AcrR family transcriptional regulator [Terracidiphilus sp.]
MSSAATPALTPRKSPVQARSSATVEAVLEATIQVLLKEGKERLTTTRVAERAGVSVGTFYQYFPNKSALLQATLRRHMEDIADTLDRVCDEQRGKPIAEMVANLINAFFAAKMRDPRVSAALYAVSSDVDGWRIAQQMNRRAHRMVVALLETAPESLTREPDLIASMLQSMMNGVSRKVLESPAPEKNFPTMRQELLFLAEVYVQACTTSV